MNFQDYCSTTKSIDNQKVSINNTFVISYSNTKGEIFSIDPEDILHFLQYLSDNYNYIENVWNKVESRKELFINYEEKSYREVYKAVGQVDELKTISSSGRSQTKPLTMVISKMICYLGQLEYVSVQSNTYFDKDSIDKALSNAPENLLELGRSASNKTFGSEIKVQFKNWLRSEGLSDKTVTSYADTSISAVDKIIRNNDPNFVSVYELKKPVDIDDINVQLRTFNDWNEKNRIGNGMYQAALNKYKEFLDDSKVSLMLSMKSYFLPKPFLLLAGISGTGKTRFVIEQAQSNETYCLVSVRPDWHEPSDLLGYVSRLSGKPQYVSTKVLSFIIRAWKAVAPDADANGHGELDLSSAPYWLCLDEMNLAPVEQYFADYLSVLESRKLRDGKYECEALLDNSLLRNLQIDGDPRKDLGLQEDDDLWAYFLENGIGIPPNLIVAGTVNMDETTHGFSRKVIDRAFTFDFGEFFPNKYSHFFEPDNKPVTFTYPHLTQTRQDDLAGTVDPGGEKTIKFLETVNGLLKSTPFELAYRALNELLLQVVCFNPQDKAQLQAVWDDFLMSKVLPRIDGDDDKLTIKKDDEAKNLLTELALLLENELDEIWSGKRKDYYRVKKDGSDITDINCRTRTKLEWMSARLEVNTFTSFWP